MKATYVETLLFKHMLSEHKLCCAFCNGVMLPFVSAWVPLRPIPLATITEEENEDFDDDDDDLALKL